MRSAVVAVVPSRLRAYLRATWRQWVVAVICAALVQTLVGSCLRTEPWADAGARWTPVAAVSPATLAGVFVPLSVTFRAAGRTSQQHGVEWADTLTLTAAGEWTTSHGATTYTIRHDSLVVATPSGERVYAVRQAPGQLLLSYPTTYDFNADALPETAVRQVAYRVVGR